MVRKALISAFVCAQYHPDSACLRSPFVRTTGPETLTPKWVFLGHLL